MERIERLLNLVPNDEIFGKLIGVMAMLLTKSYIDENMVVRPLTDIDIYWLNSLQFYSINGVVKCNIEVPKDAYPGVRINCLNKSPEYLDRGHSINRLQLVYICSNLGFGDMVVFFKLMYGLYSNMALLKNSIA